MGSWGEGNECPVPWSGNAADEDHAGLLGLRIVASIRPNHDGLAVDRHGDAVAVARDRIRVVESRRLRQSSRPRRMIGTLANFRTSRNQVAVLLATEAKDVTTDLLLSLANRLRLLARRIKSDLTQIFGLAGNPSQRYRGQTDSLYAIGQYDNR